MALHNVVLTENLNTAKFETSCGRHKTPHLQHDKGGIVMELRFCESKIRYWAERYPNPISKLENELTNKTLVNKVQEQKYLDKNLLRKVAKWKSQRRAALIENNSESDVREITGYALQSPSERIRWGVLSCLDGVRVPKPPL